MRGMCTEEKYRRWLIRKAMAHVRRDRARGRLDATGRAYRAAIHAAVIRSCGRDEYTGRRLDWSRISKYDNASSKAGRTRYKHRFRNLPTVDHEGSGVAAPLFAICAWRTNDAKHDLTYKDFVALCSDVLAHRRRSVLHRQGGRR